MKKTHPFDLLNSPLGGTNLIEASAGTGKTYTIAGLYLRLILEMQLSVNEILVVTFTEAATRELRERIRSRLREAADLFSGRQCEDPFLNDLLKGCRDRSEAVKKLREALRGFDQAAILTIHGFCQRMLRENAFESGALFDTELIADQDEIRREIVEDFWRIHFYEASPLFINYTLGMGIRPDTLHAFLNSIASQPNPEITPKFEIADATPMERAFKVAFEELQEAWAAGREEVENVLLTYDGLNRVKYAKRKIPFWIQCMDDYTASGGNDPSLFKGFEKFSSSALEVAVKKDRTPPGLPFFDVCEMVMEKGEVLKGVYKQNLIGLKARLMDYARKELMRRKERKNVQSFDDLLSRMRQALQGTSGEGLSRIMGRKYRAALVDEFQDTDPIQYAIFKEVFSKEGGILYYIGDPKQAIYSFRGADLFAYLKASGDVESRYTLVQNWRSEPGLIDAVNTLFSNPGLPFIYDKIGFQPALPAEEKNTNALNIDGKRESPFHLWFMDSDKIAKPGKPISRGKALELIPGAVAAEISELVHLGRKNRALIGKRPLREGDISVLVRRNMEAGLIKEALSALNIPSVLYSTGNIFESREALEMERLLDAIAQPDRGRLFMAGLATDFIGMKGEALDALMRDETLWEEWIVKFRIYHDLWKNRGFIQMFRHLNSRERVLSRLTGLDGGERRTTNLLHLSEILHQISVQKKLNMGGLLKWFREKRERIIGSDEEHLLRLESDENAVKLVTIHKSKGLEYPIVFCPFLWDGSRLRGSEEAFLFHDEGDEQRLTIDLGSPGGDGNRRSAERERLAENLRLFYVALTRAKSRCTLVWGRFRGAETSAPAYLFYPPVSDDSNDLVDHLEERVKGLSRRDFLSGPREIEARSAGAIRLMEMPVQPGKVLTAISGEKPLLTLKTFTRKIGRQWSISSFSSIISGHSVSSERADYDAQTLSEASIGGAPEQPGALEASRDIFSFPRGARAGTFMHDLFEHLDFARMDPLSVKGLVKDKLLEYGFEATWQGPLYDMILRVLTTPLGPGQSDFPLSKIRKEERVNELAFYFPLKTISPEALRDLFGKSGHPFYSQAFPERIGRLDFSPVKGFMRGFMDMVFRFNGRFFLVDWKSNFLGPRVEDYGREGLSRAMEGAFYILQYVIYTLALNQYLRLRLPDYDYERDFGGIFYVFLRGVDPMKGADYGIYRDRPPEALIRDLSEALIG